MENNGQEPKISRFEALKAKLRQSPVTVIAVLSAAFIVLSAVVIISIIGANNKTPHNPDERGLHQSDTAERFERLHAEVKQIVSKYGISDDAVYESIGINRTGEMQYFVRMNAEEGAVDELRQTLLNVYSRNGFVPLYSTGVNHLIAAASGYKYEIFIDEDKQATTLTPDATDNVTQTPPSVVTPAQPTPPERGNGRIALLIDDAGMNLNLAERLQKIKAPMAVAILPHLPYSRETADLVRSKGNAVFLHFPMEPLSYPAQDPGQGAVLLHMPDLLIQQVTKQNVENLGSIDGANNHMGSALTEDPVKMRQVLESLRPYTTNFVDSNTSSKSIALEICEESGFHCGLNRKFIDNENDHDYIRGKFYEAATLANRQGGIIVIAHLRPDTVTVMETVIPELQKLGYQFVPINTVMR